MNERDTELAMQAGFNSFDTECYEGLDVLIDLIRADERKSIVTMLKDEVNVETAADCIWEIEARGNT